MILSPLYTEPPEPLSLTSRDNTPLPHCQDYLFSTAVLKHFGDDVEWLNRYKQPDGSSTYLLEAKDGTLRRPMDGIPVAQAPAEAPLNRIRRATLRRAIADKLFDFRECLRKGHILDANMSIWIPDADAPQTGEDGRKSDSTNRKRRRTSADPLGLCEGEPQGHAVRLFHEGRIIPGTLSFLEANLIHKLHDPEFILDFARRAPDTYTPLDPSAGHTAICPICGPVKTLSAYVSSPDWTWENLCGREFNMQICPHCLAVLEKHLTVMN